MNEQMNESFTFYLYFFSEPIVSDTSSAALNIVRNYFRPLEL